MNTQTQTGKAGAPLFKYVLLAVIIAFSQCLTAQEKLSPSDWKVSAEVWTFHKFTLAEALDKLDSCGIKYVGGHPNQEIGHGIEGNMDYDKMTPEACQKVLDMLDAKGMTMVSYGVTTPRTASGWVKLFEFAKRMHVQILGVEPHVNQMPLVSALADEYKIDIAIHNHPKPSYFWNPDQLLAAIKGASPRVGACADIGHWVRSGLDPIECLKKLEGHVIEFHMKDLNEKGVDEAHDVPWGTGVSNIAGIMQEMKRQGFKGFVSVEYEYHWYNNVPEVKLSVEYFEKEAKKLLGN